MKTLLFISLVYFHFLISLHAFGQSSEKGTTNALSTNHQSYVGMWGLTRKFTNLIFPKDSITYRGLSYGFFPSSKVFGSIYNYNGSIQFNEYYKLIPFKNGKYGYLASKYGWTLPVFTGTGLNLGESIIASIFLSSFNIGLHYGYTINDKFTAYAGASLEVFYLYYLTLWTTGGLVSAYPYFGVRYELSDKISLALEGSLYRGEPQINFGIGF